MKARVVENTHLQKDRDSTPALAMGATTRGSVGVRVRGSSPTGRSQDSCCYSSEEAC